MAIKMTKAEWEAKPNHVFDAIIGYALEFPTRYGGKRIPVELTDIGLQPPSLADMALAQHQRQAERLQAEGYTKTQAEDIVDRGGR